jgi:hypothetical protein
MLFSVLSQPEAGKPEAGWSSYPPIFATFVLPCEMFRKHYIKLVKHSRLFPKLVGVSGPLIS